MDESVYATGESPQLGDVVECTPGEGAHHPGHGISEGERYIVAEVDGGYVFFADDYGWWPTRFALVRRAGLRPEDYSDHCIERDTERARRREYEAQLRSERP